MSKKPENLIGQKFGKITVLGISKKINGEYYTLCKCDCGKKKQVRTNSIRRNKSCGECYDEFPIRLRKIFHGMLQRCYNQNTINFHEYGGRGIEICKKWLEERKHFFTWSMKHGYNEKLTIDRIDSNKGYSPNNCRWVTRQVQNSNRKSNILLSYNEETKTLAEWSRVYKVYPSTANRRYKRGLPFEEIFELNKNRV